MGRLVDQLLKMSLRYVMITCLTHEDSIGGKRGLGVRCKGGGVGGGVGRAKHLGEGRVGKQSL